MGILVSWDRIPSKTYLFLQRFTHRFSVCSSRMRMVYHNSPAVRSSASSHPTPPGTLPHHTPSGSNTLDPHQVILFLFSGFYYSFYLFIDIYLILVFFYCF